MKFITLFFNGLFCLIATVHLHGQNIDSLKQILSQQKDDSLKVKTYLNISKSSYDSPDSMFIYAQKGLELSEKIGWKNGIGSSYHYLGLFYLNKQGQSQKDKVLDSFLKALENLEDRKLIVNSYGALTGFYADEREYNKALNYANMALNSAGDNPSLKIYSIINIADVYRYMNQLDKAKEYYLDALNLLNLTDIENKIFLHLTTLYFLAVNRDSACIQLQESYKYITEAKQLYETSEYNHVTLYSRILAEEGEIIVEMVKNNCVPPNTSEKILLDNAEENLTKSLEIDIASGDSIQIMNRYGILYHIKKEKGDYKKALEYSEKYFQDYNSFYSQENKNRLAAIEKEYQAKEYKLQIEEKDRQFKYIALLVILLFIIALLLLIFNSIRKRKNKKLNELNNQLEEKNTKLAEANQMKIKLLGIINHDLRKPVAHLISYLELKKNIPECISETYEKEIERRGLQLSENLLHNMEDLLSWSKSQMDNFHPHFEKINISRLFSDVHSFFNNTNDIQFIFEEDIELFIDINYLKVIMRNLTFNSIQAIEKSNKKPDIKWTAQKRENKTLLTIKDNGSGMPEEKIKILKEGVDNLSISQGLGLYIIYDLAKSISCEIDVISCDGIGTTISLLIN